MRIAAKFLLDLLLYLFIFACAKNENQEKPAKPIDATPVLEISQDARGMWDVTGKTLFFRLYDNGFVEFEIADENKKIRGKINQAEEINSLEQTKIIEEEFQKIIGLAAVEDFQKVQDNYQRKCCCTDATLNYKISFKTDGNQKNISLNNYCGLDEITNPQTRYSPGFPKALSELMSAVGSVRSKYTPR